MAPWHDAGTDDSELNSVDGTRERIRGGKCGGFDSSPMAVNAWRAAPSPRPILQLAAQAKPQDVPDAST